MPSDIPVFVKILGQKDASFNAVLGQVKKDLKDTSSEVASFGLASAASIGAAAVSLGALAAKAVSTAGSFELLESKLRAVLRNSQAAQKVFQDAVQFASVTPFGVDGIVKASITLTAFGQNARQVLPTVANLAAAFGERVEDSATVIGKAFAGSLEGFESLRNQYGISTALLKQYGAQVDKSTGALKLQGEGLDRARAALTAIIQLRYGGATEEASRTLTGALSNVEDGIQRVSASFGKTLLPAATFAAKGLASVLDTVESIPSGLKTIIAGATVMGAALATAAAGAVTLGTAGIGLYAALNALGNRIPALTIPIIKLQDGLAATGSRLGAFGGQLAAVHPAIAAFGVAVGVATVAVLAYENAMEKAGAEIAQQSRELQGAVNDFKLYRDAINAALPAGQQLIESNKDVAIVSKQISDAFKSVSSADLVASFEKAGLTLDDTRKALSDNALKTDDVRQKMRDLAPTITDAEVRLADLNKRLGETQDQAQRSSLAAQIQSGNQALEEMKTRFRDLTLVQKQLANGRAEIQGVVSAFEGFQKPLAAAIDSSKKLDTFLQFANKAKDAETLSNAAKLVNADLAQMVNTAKSLGLPTDRQGILEAMVNATGTRLEFLKQELAVLEQQENFQTKLLETERALEAERVTQVERRFAREQANRKVRLDGQEEDLQAVIKTEKEKLAIVKGSTEEEIALTKRLDALRNRPQTGAVNDQIRATETKLAVVRKAADQEIAAKNAIRNAEKGLLTKSVTDAQTALDQELKASLDTLADLKEAQDTTASAMVAAYDPVLQKLEAWKKAHQDLINQSPALKKAFEGAVRQVESGQRTARKEVKNENLTTIKDQISTNTGEAITASQKLLAIESGIVALQKAKALNLIDQKTAQHEINALKRQELETSKAVVAEQARNNVEFQTLKAQGIEEEIQILEARQQAGEKVEDALKAKRQERLQAALDAIELEYNAEIAADGNKEIAAAKRKAKIDSLLRGEYLAAIQQQQQLEAAEQTHQDKLKNIREDRFGGKRSPLKSFDEAFGDSSALEFSGVDSAKFGQSALHAETSPFRAQRKIPSPAQVAAGLGFNAQSGAQFSKSLDKTINNTSGPTYNVHFNVDGVPPHVAELARQVAAMLGKEARAKTFVNGRNTPKSKA